MKVRVRIDTAAAAVAQRFAKRYGMRASEIYPLARDLGCRLPEAQVDDALTLVCETGQRLRVSFGEALAYIAERIEELEEEG